MRQAHQLFVDEYGCHQCGPNSERSGCALDFSDPRANFSDLGFGKTSIFAPHLNR